MRVNWLTNAFPWELVVEQLEARDVLLLSSCCSFLRSVCARSSVWRGLTQRVFCGCCMLPYTSKQQEQQVEEQQQQQQQAPLTWHALFRRLHALRLLPVMRVQGCGSDFSADNEYEYLLELREAVDRPSLCLSRHAGQRSVQGEGHFKSGQPFKCFGARWGRFLFLTQVSYDRPHEPFEFAISVVGAWHPLHARVDGTWVNTAAYSGRFQLRDPNTAPDTLLADMMLLRAQARRKSHARINELRNCVWSLQLTVPDLNDRVHVLDLVNSTPLRFHGDDMPDFVAATYPDYTDILSFMCTREDFRICAIADCDNGLMAITLVPNHLEGNKRYIYLCYGHFDEHDEDYRGYILVSKAENENFRCGTWRLKKN